MDTMFGRDLAGVDVPPFSYTGIAHTFNNSPFNEYPYAMARLRWFAREFHPAGGLEKLEPGLGRWVPEDEFIERHTLNLRHGADRHELFDRVSANLSARNSGELTFDALYLYPPVYGDGPDDPVRHSFRIFGHADAEDRVTALHHLHEAVEEVLNQVEPG